MLRRYSELFNLFHLKTLNISVKEHRAHKGLKKSHNLRDHMSPLELALTILGETTTAELARHQDAQGFYENKEAAKAGGKIAGGARKNIESKIKKPVVTKDNFLPSSKQPKLT